MKTQFFIVLSAIGLVVAIPPRFQRRGSFIPSPRDPNYSYASLYANPFAPQPASLSLGYRQFDRLPAFQPQLANYNGILSQKQLIPAPTVAPTSLLSSPALTPVAGSQLSAHEVQLLQNLISFQGPLPADSNAALSNSGLQASLGLAGLGNPHIQGGIQPAQLSLPASALSLSDFLGLSQTALPTALNATLPTADQQTLLGLAGLANPFIQGGLQPPQLSLPTAALTLNDLLGLSQTALPTALNATLPTADQQTLLGLAGLTHPFIQGELQPPQLSLPASALSLSDLLGLSQTALPTALNPTLPTVDQQTFLRLAGLTHPFVQGGLQPPQLSLPVSALSLSDLLGLTQPALPTALNATLPTLNATLPTMTPTLPTADQQTILGLEGLTNPLALQLGGLPQPQLALPASGLIGSDPRLQGRPQFFLIGTVAGRLPLPHVHVTNTYRVPVGVPQPYNVYRDVPVGVLRNVPYPVDKPYPVGVRKPYAVPVDKPYQVAVDRPYGVAVPHAVPFPVVRPVGVPVPHPVPVEVQRPYPVPVSVPVAEEEAVQETVEEEVPVQQPIEVEVPVERPFQIPQSLAVEISQPYAVPYDRVVPAVRRPIVIPYSIERQVVHEIRHQEINHGTPQPVSQVHRQEIIHPHTVSHVTTRPELQVHRQEIIHPHTVSHVTTRPELQVHRQEIIHPHTVTLVTPRPVLHVTHQQVTNHGVPRPVLHLVRHPLTQIVNPQPIFQEVRHQVVHHVTQRPIVVADQETAKDEGGDEDEDEDEEKSDEYNEAEENQQQTRRRN